MGSWGGVVDTAAQHRHLARIHPARHASLRLPRGCPELVHAVLTVRACLPGLWRRFPHGESGADVYDRMTVFQVGAGLVFRLGVACKCWFNCLA